jgi:threonine/homoserine efflux transporter RhtA
MRMLAVLFAIILLATVSGADDVVPVGFAAIVAVIAWVAAVLIAGVLLAPLAIRGRPGRTAATVALAIAAVVVLPIRDDWVPTLGTAAACAGYLPLPLEVSKHLRDDQYAPWGIDNGCDD